MTDIDISPDAVRGDLTVLEAVRDEQRRRCNFGTAKHLEDAVALIGALRSTLTESLAALDAVIAERDAAYAEVDTARLALTACEKQATRWAYARQYLAIEDIERWSSEDWVGHHPDEMECGRADEAIDRAMEAK